MRIQVKKTGGLATSPRTSLKFNKGEVLDSEKVEVKHLERLVEIGWAVKLAEGQEPEKDLQEELVSEATKEAEVTTEETTEIPEFEDKDTLEAYASEKGIELDKRKSLSNMLKDFKEKLGG